MRETTRDAWLPLFVAATLLLSGIALGQQGGDQDAQKAQQEMMKALQQMQQGGADPVDFRTYKELMPAAVLGVDRVDCEGTNQKVQGMATSTTSCSYGDSGKRIDVRFSDMGNMGQIAMLSQFGLQMEIDSESDSGFERTTTVAGFRGMHTWDEPSQFSKLVLMLGDRGMMEIRVSEAGSDGAVEAARALPLKDFARLASNE